MRAAEAAGWVIGKEGGSMSGGQGLLGGPDSRYGRGAGRPRRRSSTWPSAGVDRVRRPNPPGRRVQHRRQPRWDLAWSGLCSATAWSEHPAAGGRQRRRDDVDDGEQLLDLCPAQISGRCARAAQTATKALPSPQSPSHHLPLQPWPPGLPLWYLADCLLPEALARAKEIGRGVRS